MPAQTRFALAKGSRAVMSAAALGLLFFFSAAVAMREFGINTPIWFSNAFAVVWLLQHHVRLWPLLLSAVYLADTLAINGFGSGPAPVLALADAAECLAAAALIRHIGGPAVALASASGMVRLVVICLAVPLLSSAWGASVLTFVDGGSWLGAFVQWYGATSLGLLIVCPTVLIWLVPELRPQLSRGEIVRVTLLAGVLAVLTAVIFNLETAAWMFLIFPALLLLVWNSGLAGASLGALVLLAVGLVETLSGESVITVLIYPVTGKVAEIQALQVFLATMALASLPLAVVLTDQRRLSAELVRVAEARSEFLAAMSHEIRTPMTGVLGMVDLLDAEPLTPRQKSYVESIRASGRHLLNIINDILDFSRIETGRIELEHIDFSLPALLERLRSLLNPLAVERRIALSFDLPADSPPVVRGDPTRLKQVLLNLAANAIKFTPEGEVDINVGYARTGPAEFRFRFEVRDTGIGIPPDKQSDLFAAFTQADHSTRRRFGGSGLGLAISRRLVTAMGGEIGVESQEGEGSLFWFEVPLEEGDAMLVPSSGSDAAAGMTPRRILLAEDVELNRDIIRTMLERDGHSVTIAADGEEALALASRTAFDLILMDVHMPVLDGLEATRLIRQLPKPRGDLPILALTANVMMTEQEKCLRAGMNGVLMKPIDWDRVRAAIDRFCTAQPVAPEDEVTKPAFDAAVFARISAIIAPPLLQRHVDALRGEVRRLSVAKAGEADGEVAHMAHKIISQAGMLGLMRLSARAADVERACAAGQDVPEALKRFASVAGDVEALSPELSPKPAEVRRTS